MRIKKIRDVKTPERGTSKSAGIDFFIPNDYETGNRNEIILVKPGAQILIPSGIVADIPEGYMLTGFNKSGIATKKGLLIGACVCDEDYQGEIHINLHNVSSHHVILLPGDKVAQFILVPVFYDTIDVVDGELFESETERGEGGFGSTGS